MVIIKLPCSSCQLYLNYCPEYMENNLKAVRLKEGALNDTGR